MSQALYRKWRPLDWESVIGQEHVVQTLRNAVVTERVAHACLFAGPRGTGKTTTARILAKAINCLVEDPARRPCNECQHCEAVNAGRFMDLIEIDAASNTSVDDVRDLRDKINFLPNQGRAKVYIIDEVHMLSTAAFNALLKTLEEPPRHAMFVLATTEPHKIPATVHSRCQRHEFRRIPVDDMVAQLQKIAGEEGIQADPQALTLLARQATGSLRDAISLLDQLASAGQEISVDLAQTVLGTAASQSVLDVIEAILERDAAQGLDSVHKALDTGSDPRQFARQIIDYLRNLLLIQNRNANQVDATQEIKDQMERHAGRFKDLDLLAVIRAFNQAAYDSRIAWQPALPLEMAVLEAMRQPGAGRSRERESPLGWNRTNRLASGSPPRIERSQQPQASQQVDSPSAGEPEAELETNEADSDESESMQRLVENWGRILQLVRQRNPNTYGLLNSCKSRQFKGNTLWLGFASDVLKNQMIKKDNLEIVQSVLSHVLEKEIVIKCIITTAKRTAIPAEVDSEGMVASALRDLGGEIVDVQ